MTVSKLLAAATRRMALEAFVATFVEEPWMRRSRILTACKQWEFDAYRVLAAGGLCDRDPVRDAEYQDYLRWKDEPPRTVQFRSWAPFTESSSSQSPAPGS